jgi:signal transduction histidine kinase
MRRVRALIVDDSEDDADLLVRRLRIGGYEITHRRVETADEMRLALNEVPWEIVLSDFSMPSFNGMAALRILKETGLDLPFIIVSGTIGEETAVEALKSGAHDFFIKGRLERLPSAVEHELRDAELRRTVREAARAQEEFLSIASHELRTPITSLDLQIRSALRLARSRRDGEAAPDKMEAKLEGVARQASRLIAFVDSLLNFTRITAGRLTISLETVDLGLLAESVVGNLDGIIKDSGSTVLLKAKNQVVGQWDPVWLEIAISNLLSNAAKFGEGKPIEVTIDRDNDRARLMIVDHGIGIASQDQARVFQRFERAAPSRQFGGFGIGLWVTQQVVEAHLGSIEVASGTEPGSTFTVLLPAALRSRTSRTGEHDIYSETASPGQSQSTHPRGPGKLL